MTPQEKDLIDALLGRLQQQASQGGPKDPEAAALIARGMAAQPDAPYLLMQTVLIQDMALAEAHSRMKALEDQLAGAKALQSAPSSFLGNARGSVPASGPWGHAAAAPSPPPQPASGPVWTQSGTAGAAMAQPAYPAQPPYAAQPMSPLAAPGAGSGFLRQAAMTAAGVAGGALLFQGIQSMFGPHYGGGFMGGMPMQPGIGETVINNNYYDSTNDGTGAVNAPNTSADYDPGSSDPGLVQADDQNFGDQGFDSGGDFGGGESGNFDV
jgi:hypothetical protein